MIYIYINKIFWISLKQEKCIQILVGLPIRYTDVSSSKSGTLDIPEEIYNLSIHYHSYSQ